MAAQSPRSVAIASGMVMGLLTMGLWALVWSLRGTDAMVALPPLALALFAVCYMAVTYRQSSATSRTGPHHLQDHPSLQRVEQQPEPRHDATTSWNKSTAM